MIRVEVTVKVTLLVTLLATSLANGNYSIYKDSAENLADNEQSPTLPRLGEHTISCSFTKSGVPTPVTGSHPGTAEKPCVLQPGFEPEVMSLKARALVEA